MAAGMKEILFVTKLKAKEYTLGLTENDMMVRGLITK